MVSSTPTLVKEGNRMFEEKFSMEEIKDILFQLNADKSLGLGGFNAIFFQKCWSFLGSELWEAIEASRNVDNFFPEINNTFIALIPKKVDFGNVGRF